MRGVTGPRGLVEIEEAVDVAEPDERIGVGLWTGNVESAQGKLKNDERREREKNGQYDKQTPSTSGGVVPGVGLLGIVLGHGVDLL